LADLPALREHLRKDTKVAIDFAAAAAKRRYDGKYEAVKFQEGEKVYLKLHYGYYLPSKLLRKFS